MNNVTIVGNLARDAELRETQSGKSVANFTIAAQRSFKNANGEYQADFIPCVAWGSTADFISKYFKKGSKIGVVGNIQTRDYENKDGNRVYVVEVNVSQAEFVESKNTNQQAKQEPTIEEDDTALPFDL